MDHDHDHDDDGDSDDDDGDEGHHVDVYACSTIPR
jgi:hypothetical protein